MEALGRWLFDRKIDLEDNAIVKTSLRQFFFDGEKGRRTIIIEKLVMRVFIYRYLFYNMVLVKHGAKFAIIVAWFWYNKI